MRDIGDVFGGRRKKRDNDNTQGREPSYSTDIETIYNEHKGDHSWVNKTVATFMPNQMPVPGQMTFPFSFMIDETFPGSFEINWTSDGNNPACCMLVYKLTGLMKFQDYSGVHTLFKDVIIRVGQKPDNNVISRQDAPFENSNLRKQINAPIKQWCFFNKGAFKCSGQFEKEIYPMGERVNVMVDIDNSQCSLPMTEIDYDLRAVHEVRIGDHAHGWTTHIDSHKNTEQVEAGRRRSLTLGINLEQNDKLFTCNGKFFKSNVWFNVEPNVSQTFMCCCGADLKMSHQIHVIRIHNVDPFQYVPTGINFSNPNYQAQPQDGGQDAHQSNYNYPNDPAGYQPPFDEIQIGDGRPLLR